jgi:hypothetical protein
VLHLNGFYAPAYVIVTLSFILWKRKLKSSMLLPLVKEQKKKEKEEKRKVAGVPF